MAWCPYRWLGHVHPSSIMTQWTLRSCCAMFTTVPPPYEWPSSDTRPGSSTSDSGSLASAATANSWRRMKCRSSVRTWMHLCRYSSSCGVGSPVVGSCQETRLQLGRCHPNGIALGLLGQSCCEGFFLVPDGPKPVPDDRSLLAPPAALAQLPGGTRMLPAWA